MVSRQEAGGRTRKAFKLFDLGLIQSQAPHFPAIYTPITVGEGRYVYYRKEKDLFILQASALISLFTECFDFSVPPRCSSNSMFFYALLACSIIAYYTLAGRPCHAPTPHKHKINSGRKRPSLFGY